jgi:hypothetical protein
MITTHPEPDPAPFKVHLLTKAGRVMRARSEPVRAFFSRDEAGPAPSLKLLRSPDFQGGRGRAATFRAKTRGLRLIEAGWEDVQACSRMTWRAAARKLS